jgi:hypothetical protein
MNTQQLITLLQQTADSFPIETIFMRQRQRELPVRNFIAELLNKASVENIREQPYNRTDNIGRNRLIDLVVGKMHYQLGHFTLAQYNKTHLPINSKVNLEQDVFRSIEGNTPSEIEKYLIYVTTDLAIPFDLTKMQVNTYPLLKYFINAQYSEKTQAQKLALRNRDIEALSSRKDVKLITTVKSKESLPIEKGLNATLTLDLIKI